VPATVVSRCQRFDFRRIPLAAVVDRLAYIAKEEGITCPKDALEMIARIATGSLRDAINLLEQLVDSYGQELTLDHVREGLGLVVDARSAEFAAHVLRRELAGGLALISSVRDDGLDLRQFQRQVVAHMRGLLLAKAGVSATDTWSDEQLAGMRELVADVPAERIVAALHAFGEADLRADPLSPLPLELALATSVLGAGAPAAPANAAPAASRPAPQTAPPRAAAPKPPAKTDTAVKGPAPAEQPPKPPRAATRSPAPDGEAAPASAAASSENGSPLADQARERWPEILAHARGLHYRVGALLNSGCGIVRASDDEVVFGFRHTIHLDRMHGDGGENLRALQQAVEEVLGAGRTVRCVLDADVEVLRANRGGHLVRGAQELLSSET
jgi:DNA polymerase-3 subunit gamma/tau